MSTVEKSAHKGAAHDEGCHFLLFYCGHSAVIMLIRILQVKRGLSAAKMNISMGFMLLFMALLQIFMFEANTTRTILGTLFLLMGLYNFFSGVRSHLHYRSLER
jgi:Ca2+/Na+ antiporter